MNRMLVYPSLNLFLTCFVTSFQQRTLITKKALRLLLKDYVSKAMDMHAKENLIQLLKEEIPVLAVFVAWCEATFESWHYIPKPILDLLGCFAHISPVCSYYPPSDELHINIRSLRLSETKIGDNVESMMFIQNAAPIIFNALATINCSKLPDEWFELFSLLHKKAVGTFKNDPHNLPPAATAEINNSLAYFPNWPIQCSRGSYRLDKANVKAAEVCKKKKTSKHSLMPGLFTVYCEHGMKTLHRKIQVPEKLRLGFLYTMVTKMNELDVFWKT